MLVIPEGATTSASTKKTAITSILSKNFYHHHLRLQRHHCYHSFHYKHHYEYSQLYNVRIKELILL